MNQKLAKLVYLLTARIRREDVLGVLKQLEGSQWHSTEHLLDVQWEKFKNILQYAYDEFPYYRERCAKAGIEPGDIKTRDDLQAIPILTKGEIRQNFDALVSKNVELTEQFGTSGSMAEPLMMIRCRDSMAHHRANMFRFRRWFDVDIGSFEATFRGTNFPLNALRKLQVKDFLLNRERIPERNLSKGNLDKYYRRMKKAKPATFYGFPTLIQKFTDHLIESGIGPKPFPSLKCIIPTSEMAYPWQKNRWKEYYGVPVAEEYGCTEAGLIGMECPHGSWHVPVESCLVEFVPMENGAEEENQCKIIVTDLMNRAMPMIRYDVADSAAPGIEKCACGRGLPTMSAFLGRVAKLIDLPDGRTIHSLDFYYIFRKASEIKPDAIREFQVKISPPGKFEINIIPGHQFNDDVMDFLKHKIGYALGDGSDITYTLVTEIQNGKHGKYNKVVFVDE